MDSVNLLAFIQIAVAFDFGLVYLSNTHIFTSILNSFLTELSDRNRAVIKEADNLCEANKHSHDIGIRKNRSILVEDANSLKYLLNSGNVRWEKYAYTGIYSGVYGLICLFLIGLSHCEFDEGIRNFLLISGEFILAFQFLNTVQLSRIAETKISIVKIIERLWWLLGILTLSFLMVCYDVYFHFWKGFDFPFVVLTTIIVYFPIWVYLWRLLRIRYKVMLISHRCRDTINKIKKKLSL